jgi:PAS domain S-box-containing protein
MDQKPAYHELEQQIVALKQEIEKLRSESIKYRTLFNFFPLGITVSDSIGQIIEANETAEKLLGVKKEEHEKRAIDGHEWRIVRLDGSDMPSDEWASVIALKEKRLVTHCEMGIVKSNGQVTWIDVTAAPLPIEGLGVVITYTDISEKIEARKKQMENENKFRLFFENVGFYGYMLSPEGFILEVNNTALSAMGYSREEIIGRPLSALYAQESLSNAEKAFQEWQTNGRVSNVELVVQAKDGSKRDVLLNADSVRDDSGRIVHSTSIQIDITDRKKSEANLEKYKNIVSSTTDGISFLDMDYRYVIVNEAYEQFSGVRRDQFIGLTVSEYLGKDVFENYIKPYFDRCLQGETINYQEWFEYPTIGRRFVDVTYYPFRDSSGCISGAIANTRDITVSKQSDDQLRFQAMLLEAIEQAVIVTDLSGRIVYWNPFAVKLYGWSAEEAIGKAAINLIATRDSEKQGFEIMTDLQAGKCWTGEYLAKNRDGNQLTTLSTVSPIRGINGEITHLICVSSDISERKQMEMNLRLHEVIVSSATEPMALIDRQYTYLLVNKSYEDFGGYSRKDIIGKRISDLLGEDVFQNTVKEKVDQCLMGVPINYSAWFQSPTKGARYMNINYYPYKSDNGDVVGLINIAYDLTEQKQLEVLLRKSEEQYRFLMESITDSIYVLDPEWRHVMVNQAASGFTGLTREQLIGGKLTELFPGVEDTVFFKAFQNVMNNRTPDTVVGEYSFGSGLRRWYEVYVYPVSQGILCIARDITDRKTAEMKLEESELLHRTTIANISDAVMITDDEGNFTYICPNTYTIFGFSSEELFEQRNISYVFKNRLFVIEELIKKSELLNIEVDITDKAGNQHALLVDIKRVSIKNGTILYTCKDITEIVQSKKALAESKSVLKATLDGLPSHIALLDEHGVIIMVNRTWRDFAEKNGIASDSVSEGKNYIRVCDEAKGENAEESKSFSTGIREVLSGEKEAFVLEYPCHSPDEKRWFVAHVCRVPGEGPKRVVVAHENITDRNLSQLALKESEEKYRSIMEAMDESTYICSSDFQIVYMNSAMIKWLGRDATGETCHKAIHGLDTQCSWCVHEKVMKGETVKTELVEPGSNRIFFISHAPIFHSNGTVSKLSLYRDITEIKKLGNRIQQAQKMESIGNLAGGIAHDFNNILCPIIGLSELLLDDFAQDSPERECAEEIFKAGKRGSDLVKQILAFSRQSEHKMIPTRVQNILKEVLKLTRSTIPSNIEINQDIQPDCGLILADPTQIHQVAMNIITNAYHAMEENAGQMHVRLREINLEAPERLDPGKYAMLSISDSGHGMPANLINKIFDPYFTTKEQGKGTGLGLAVVHGIVKEHKGDVTVYSEVGKGSTFNVYLPLLEKSAADDPIPTEKCRLGTERILLADDEASVAKLVKLMLERIGYRVTLRTSSSDALEAFKVNPSNFDLVISDMAMPNMTGIQLAQELKKIRPDIPIIICTGFSERINEKKAETIGIEAFMMKPIVKSDLSNMIRKVLDESKAKTKR